MADAPTQAVQVIDIEELFTRLQPTLDAIQALVKPLDSPERFLIYPLLTAQALFELADGDLDIAKSNHANFDGMVILAFMTLRYRARQEGDEDEEVIPPSKGMH